MIEASIPALITASSEIGELRSATVGSIIVAQRKEVTVWGAQELGVDLSQMRRTNLVRLFSHPRRETKCELAEGESLDEVGASLAVKLREAKII